MYRARITADRTGAGTTLDPYRPADFACESWQDVTGQPTADIAAGMHPFTVEALLTDEQLAAVQADARFCVLWAVDETVNPAEIAALTSGEKDALKASLANIYYTDVVEYVTKDTDYPTVIADDLIVQQQRPPWQAGLAVTVGQVYQYSGNLYEVIQAHTTQSDWTPDIVPALFKRFYEPSDNPWPWVQPTGAHDAYPAGARVTHGGYTWQSDIAANVWEPGVYGWTNLTPPPPPPQYAAWAYPVAYKIGDKVTYNGRLYECRQAHTSQAGWTPPVVPALWLDKGVYRETTRD